MFFSFDGVDGVGKSTQVQLFCQWLAEGGRPPGLCRDPGTTPLGEQIRGILLAPHDETPMSGRSEMLLYMAARAQLVDEVIRPALAEGKAVVSDRFLLANIVYQGYGGGVDLATIRRVGAAAVDGVMPDCTFLLDMDPELALGRVGRQLDRMERRGREYRDRLRAGFLAEARQMGESVHVVDAGRPIADVQREIRDLATQALAARAVQTPCCGGTSVLIGATGAQCANCRFAARLTLTMAPESYKIPAALILRSERNRRTFRLRILVVILGRNAR